MFFNNLESWYLISNQSKMSNWEVERRTYYSTWLELLVIKKALKGVSIDRFNWQTDSKANSRLACHAYNWVRSHLSPEVKRQESSSLSHCKNNLIRKFMSAMAEETVSGRLNRRVSEGAYKQYVTERTRKIQEEQEALTKAVWGCMVKWLSVYGGCLGS